LEGIEILIKLIKNNKNILFNNIYNFTDSEESDDLYELNKLFDDMLFLKSNNKSSKYNNKINKYINKIEQMINELYGFEKYVLK
jgi:nitrate/nitrite-specific signal transduction histidine kinase